MIFFGCEFYEFSNFTKLECFRFDFFLLFTKFYTLKVSTFKILNILAVVSVLTVNFLAVKLPINGLTPGQISDMYRNEFAPAGITFSIWSVIYGLIIGFIVWQYRGSSFEKEDAIQKIGWLLVANSMFNICWILSWHFLILPLSVVIMLGILWSLVRLNTVISFDFKPKTPTRGLLKSAFGVYLGWICIATIANFTALLVSLKWNAFGLSETFWTGGMIGIGALIVAFITWRLQNLFIGLAVLWALLGIIIRQNQLHSAFTPISWAAVTWMMPVVAAMIYSRTWKYVIH